ncbi:MULTISPECIES: Cof-type HAD-IIB family hydrolase [unclassified Clostridium]|uniref:Cof-type HAD-IIB family hydrolase n=1 Tax=unclassified Clostridium TaxID=2614128 RepID=UPI001897AD83|nr:MULTISPECIES: Cof-type HAD-IIB family hydrolase [unclassified Clostridium]MBP3917286.1 HAD family phosphatase [Clostridium sp.]MEE0932671.1 Cof-type HAD-IIB family hydrolase [Clostridium sp.]
MIKLIASDMDGTLLNDDHMISDENLKAIRKAQEMGRHFTIVTGRDYGAVKSYLEECNLKCECILSNGAEYRDVNGNVIESVYMNKNSVKIVFDILNEAGLCIQLMTNNGSYITNKESDKQAIIDRFKLFNPKMTEEEVIEFVKNFHKQRGMKNIDDVYEILESDVEILKIVTFDNDEKLIASLKEKLKENTSDLAVASTFSNDIEISDIEAQKGLILAKTIKKMGIDKSEVIVLGDSFNDYSMFTEFENSYAMENAIPEIKEIAKYVTDSNNNDGVAKAIYKALEI